MWKVDGDALTIAALFGVIGGRQERSGSALDCLQREMELLRARALMEYIETRSAGAGGMKKSGMVIALVAALLAGVAAIGWSARGSKPMARSALPEMEVTRLIDRAARANTAVEAAPEVPQLAPEEVLANTYRELLQRNERRLMELADDPTAQAKLRAFNELPNDARHEALEKMEAAGEAVVLEGEIYPLGDPELTTRLYRLMRQTRRFRRNMYFQPKPPEKSGDQF